MNTKKNVPDSKIRHIIWWARVDSDHRSNDATDLQSAPFGHSGIPPYALDAFSGRRGVLYHVLPALSRPSFVFSDKF